MSARSSGNCRSPSPKLASSSLISFGSNGMRNILTGKSGQLPGLFSLTVQNPPQGGQAVKNPALDRAQRTLQNFGDLLVSQSFAEPQDQRLPLPFGKQSDA